MGGARRGVQTQYYGKKTQTFCAKIKDVRVAADHEVERQLVAAW